MPSAIGGSVAGASARAPRLVPRRAPRSRPGTQRSSSSSTTQGRWSLNEPKARSSGRLPSAGHATQSRSLLGSHEPRALLCAEHHGGGDADTGGMPVVERWIVDSGRARGTRSTPGANVGEVFPDPVTPLTRRLQSCARRARLARRVGALRGVRRRRVRPGRRRVTRHLRRLLLPQRVAHPPLRGADAGPVRGSDGRAVLRRPAGHPALRGAARPTSTSRSTEKIGETFGWVAHHRVDLPELDRGRVAARSDSATSGPISPR